MWKNDVNCSTFFIFPMKDVVCKGLTILFRPQWVKSWWFRYLWNFNSGWQPHQKLSDLVGNLPDFWLPNIEWRSFGLLNIMEKIFGNSAVFPLLFGFCKPFNTLRPRQNGRHFPDAIFKCIFLNENVWILIKISLKFVPNGLINKTLALV